MKKTTEIKLEHKHTHYIYTAINRLLKIYINWQYCIMSDQMGERERKTKHIKNENEKVHPTIMEGENNLFSTPS